MATSAPFRKAFGWHIKLKKISEKLNTFKIWILFLPNRFLENLFKIPAKWFFKILF